MDKETTGSIASPFTECLCTIKLEGELCPGAMGKWGLQVPIFLPGLPIFLGILEPESPFPETPSPHIPGSMGPLRENGNSHLTDIQQIKQGGWNCSTVNVV